MVELESFKHGGTNITAFRLVDPDLEDVQNVVQDWVLGEMRFGRKIPFQGKTIKVLKVNTQTIQIPFTVFRIHYYYYITCK